MTGDALTFTREAAEDVAVYLEMVADRQPFSDRVAQNALSLARERISRVLDLLAAMDRADTAAVIIRDTTDGPEVVDVTTLPLWTLEELLAFVRDPDVHAELLRRVEQFRRGHP